MGVLKRKRESEPIAFKAPVGLKREIDYLRGRSEAAGFDLAKTITAGGWRRLCKLIKAELVRVPSSNGRIDGRMNEPSAGKVQSKLVLIFPPLRSARRVQVGWSLRGVGWAAGS